MQQTDSVFEGHEEICEMSDGVDVEFSIAGEADVHAKCAGLGRDSSVVGFAVATHFG